MRGEKRTHVRASPHAYGAASGGYRPVPRGSGTSADFAVSARGRAEERRRHRRHVLVLFYVFLFCSAVAAAVALSLTVLFRITEVRVEGSSRYPAGELAAASGIRKGDNLFLIRPGEAEKTLRAKFPYLGEISISRCFPSEVKIHVEEEPVCGAIAFGKQYIVAGADGRALEIAEKAPAGCSVLKGLAVRKAQAGEKIEFSGDGSEQLLQDVTGAFRTEGLEKISSIDFSKKYRILAVYDGRVTIDFGLPSDLGYKVRFAKKLLEENIGPKEKGTLDMSVAPSNDKAYFDPSSGPAGT